LSAALLGAVASRKRNLERLGASRQAQLEAEQRSQEKSRLLASFAHDVRSPLVSLIGSFALMEENNLSCTADIRTARASAEGLLQLVDDILELSFLGSGKLVLHPSPVDLRRLVDDLGAQARILALQKGLTVTVEVDQMVPHTVKIDRLRLQQVLSNLLTNAVKYTEKGSVTLRVLSVKEQKGVVELTFVITDTGVGISREDMNQVFREFGRLDRPIERRETGTGLGLAICKRILNAMGSDLHLESTVGRGSVFSFQLSVPALQDMALSLNANPLSGVTILYAEDEAIIRKVTSRQLSDAGATVIEAVDGADALEKLLTVSPNLFLVDIQMPRMDGVETIKRLQQYSSERDYPIFVLTSHISGPKVAEARAAGADEVFTKPVQILPLAAALVARRGDWGNHTPIMGGSVEASTEELFELQRLQAIITSNHNAFLENYLPRFEAQMRDELALLARHIVAGDLLATQTVSHRCLGICLVLGATALGERLRAIEDEAEEGDQAEVVALGEGLQDLMAKTVAAMRDFAETLNDTDTH